MPSHSTRFHRIGPATVSRRAFFSAIVQYRAEMPIVVRAKGSTREAREILSRSVRMFCEIAHTVNSATPWT